MDIIRLLIARQAALVAYKSIKTKKSLTEIISIKYNNTNLLIKAIRNKNGTKIFTVYDTKFQPIAEVYSISELVDLF